MVWCSSTAVACCFRLAVSLTRVRPASTPWGISRTILQQDIRGNEKGGATRGYLADGESEDNDGKHDRERHKI